MDSPLLDVAASLLTDLAELDDAALESALTHVLTPLDGNAMRLWQQDPPA
ncbi:MULTISPECIES: hypothetical protein [unclassified Nonomuraea]